jgi:signal transduction histidine kinase
VAKEEEKQRLAHAIHDSFSPHLLAAFFLIHGIREHLEKTHSVEAEQLAKAAKLLNETIEARHRSKQFAQMRFDAHVGEHSIKNDLADLAFAEL